MAHRSSLPRASCAEVTTCSSGGFPLILCRPSCSDAAGVALQRDAQKHQGLTRGRGLGEGWPPAALLHCEGTPTGSQNYKGELALCSVTNLHSAVTND